ncbi:MAG: hypothetical protein C4326_08330 [Ignavibacteria bacterium]
MTDEFTSIRAETRAEWKIQGSRFLAAALPVATPQEALQFLGRVRKEFWDATHHCFAYRLGTEGTHFRYSDAGEPNGTAGKPILAAIDAYGLTDLIIVVARYFGGTKLGVGGLARAYNTAANLVLDRTEKVTHYKTAHLVVTFPHAHISGVRYVVSKTGAKILDTTYDEDVHIVLEIRRTMIEEVQTQLVNHTRGNVALKQLAVDSHEPR